MFKLFDPETHFKAIFKLFDPVKEYVFYLDFSCKVSKLQYNSLAFVADLKRATDEGLLPEIAQYAQCFTASKGPNLYILFMVCNK